MSSAHRAPYPPTKKKTDIGRFDQKYRPTGFCPTLDQKYRATGYCRTLDRKYRPTGYCRTLDRTYRPSGYCRTLGRKYRVTTKHIASDIMALCCCRTEDQIHQANLSYRETEISIYSHIFDFQNLPLLRFTKLLTSTFFYDSAKDCMKIKVPTPSIATSSRCAQNSRRVF